MPLKRMMLTGAILLASGLFFASCNTVRGVGKDLERGGTKIQEMADR